MGIDVNASVFVVRRSESPDGQYNVVDVPIIEGAANSFSCNDHSVIGGRTYWYKIVLTNLSYQEEYGPIEALVEAVPTVYRVSQSYPNPFNPSCTIQYELPRAGMTSLRVFDVSGSLVRTLVDGWKETGIYAAIWDGRAHDGSKVPSGIYFYEFRAGDFAVTRKMVLLR
jgi:hypothetical protein